MRHFVLDEDAGGFVEVPAPEVSVDPADSESQIPDEAECAERIQKMREEGRLPTVEQFRAAVDKALESLDDPSKMTLERRAALLQLLGKIREAARQRAGDHLPLGTKKIQ